MSDLDRLHEIIDALPQQQPISDDEFARRLAGAGEAAWSGADRRWLYAWNELPQPHVDLTWGLLNLNPEPSSVST